MLVIHGVPLSQPFRTVVWACLIKKLPFQIKIAVPGGASGKYSTRSANYLERFPLGTIPGIQEDGDDQHPLVNLTESPAILAYLSYKHGWTDLYPHDCPTTITRSSSNSSLVLRARVDEYCHWHHSNLRSLTRAYMLRHTVGYVPPPDVANLFQRQARHGLKVLEQSYLRSSSTSSSSSSFLLGTDHPTVADLLAYEEVCQVGPEFGNLLLLDEEKYPRILAWMQRMRALPHHDAVHTALYELGPLRKKPGDDDDDRLPDADRLSAATKAGLKAIAAAQQQQQSPASRL